MILDELPVVLLVFRAGGESGHHGHEGRPLRGVERRGRAATWGGFREASLAR